MDIEFNLMTESVDHAGPVEPLCVEPGTPLRGVLELLRERKRSSALVCREGAVIGIFSERDALRVMACGEDLATPIDRVMTPHPVTVRAGDKLGTAVQKMTTGGYRRLPIVDDGGKPVGQVTVAGIVHYLVQHFPQTIYNLPPLPHQPLQQREGP